MVRRQALVRRAGGRVRFPPAPPGPTRESFWRSPLRGPWLTATLGSLLLPLVLVVGVTGFISNAAYQPALGRNALLPPGGVQPFGFGWPASPSWLYALNQGVHVTVGIVAVPLLLAKLWSVAPRLFAWPPVRDPAHAIERLSLVGLVGGAIFEFVTGILNAQLYYPWHFNFVVAHYYGAWVFLAALAIHVTIKLPVMIRAWRGRGVLAPLRADLEHTLSEPCEPGSLAPTQPAAPTISRRGLLALVGSASAGLLVVTVGQSAGGPLRRLALLAPRGQSIVDDGPNGFAVNKTAATAGVTRRVTGPDWRLTIAGAERRLLSRQELLAMQQGEHDLPIACVEGWSTTQRWSGVALRDLAALIQAPPGSVLRVESLQPHGVLRRATLGEAQHTDERALLALRVNGVDLSLDHGYPARIIVPALPGVHCTKWVATLTWVRS
jgi:DMSO/TMAO reductase YedYZ molybdopterin-dependent catalytic subunit